LLKIPAKKLTAGVVDADDESFVGNVDTDKAIRDVCCHRLPICLRKVTKTRISENAIIRDWKRSDLKNQVINRISEMYHT
jgi:hypothetical protein